MARRQATVEEVAAKEMPVAYRVFTEAIEALRADGISNDAITVVMANILDTILSTCREPERSIYTEEIVKLLTGAGGQLH